MEFDGLGEAMLSELVLILEGRGVMIRGGFIVDAIFMESSSSTKNAARFHDPGAHQARKGKSWHFNASTRNNHTELYGMLPSTS